MWLCRKEGHNVEVRVTYEAGDSDRFVKEALNLKDVDVIVAAGGDGSVNEVGEGSYTFPCSFPCNSVCSLPPHCLLAYIQPLTLLPMLLAILPIWEALIQSYCTASHYTCLSKIGITRSVKCCSLQTATTTSNLQQWFVQNCVQ